MQVYSDAKVSWYNVLQDPEIPQHLLLRCTTVHACLVNLLTVRLPTYTRENAITHVMQVFCIYCKNDPCRYTVR